MGLVSLGACVAGFVLDFIFGDPVWLYQAAPKKDGRKRTDCCRRNLMDSDGCSGIWCDGRDLVDRTEMESGSRIHTGDILVLSDFCSQMSCQRKRKGL